MYYFNIFKKLFFLLLDKSLACSPAISTPLSESLSMETDISPTVQQDNSTNDRTQKNTPSSGSPTPRSPLSEILIVPNTTPSRKKVNAVKSCARVLTSAESLEMLEKKEQQKKEEQEMKEKRKKEREEKKIEREKEELRKKKKGCRRSKRKSERSRNASQRRYFGKSEAKEGRIRGPRIRRTMLSNGGQHHLVRPAQVL